MLARDVAEGFRGRFGVSPTLVTSAPGRVNLIGEHTDYNEGFVMPVAIGRRVAVAAKPCEAPSRLVSRELGNGALFDVRSLEPGRVDGWARYPAGVAWAIAEAGFGGLPNIEAYVAAELSVGSGLSSSAAIELAFATMWNALAGLGLSPAELALLSQKAEVAFVGVRCGAMDQMASALGRQGHAMLLDTRTMEVSYVRLPDDLDVVVCDTGRPRMLAGSAYNERRAQCEAACLALGVRSLRDASLDMLKAYAHQLDPVLLRRARHVVTENARCQRFAQALTQGNYATIGELMRESHESLRYDYEVTSRELDAMAEACWNSPGCIGARMTGAGFGGACVALVRRSHIGAFQLAASKLYAATTAKQGALVVCQADDGASVAGQGQTGHSG